jgi:hypothetical protein
VSYALDRPDGTPVPLHLVRFLIEAAREADTPLVASVAEITSTDCDRVVPHLVNILRPLSRRQQRDATLVYKRWSAHYTVGTLIAEAPLSAAQVDALWGHLVAGLTADCPPIRRGALRGIAAVIQSAEPATATRAIEEVWGRDLAEFPVEVLAEAVLCLPVLYQSAHWRRQVVAQACIHPAVALAAWRHLENAEVDTILARARTWTPPQHAVAVLREVLAASPSRWSREELLPWMSHPEAAARVAAMTALAHVPAAADPAVRARAVRR